MPKLRFFICRHCGNIISLVHDAGVPVVCCGEAMQELTPNTTEAAHEKHLPVITRTGNEVTVAVGSVEHPMLAEHYIQWICLETTSGRQRRTLAPGDKPVAKFLLADGQEPVGAYEYCNVHGLWMTEA